MTNLDRLGITGLFDAHNVVELLESTGIELDPVERDLIFELGELYVELGAFECVERFCSLTSSNVVSRWAVMVAAHLYDGDEPQRLPRPSWTVPSGVRGRPLTRLEQALCRVTVERWPDPAAVSATQYALCEASGTSGELSRIQANGVRIGETATVSFGGGRDQEPRVATLDPWATSVVIRRFGAIDTSNESAPFVYDGAAPSSAKAQASVSGNLSRVLRFAGLGADPTLNPTSIRHTGALRLSETGAGIEAVAKALGCRSLDRTRAILAGALSVSPTRLSPV